ncbi:MAG: hypothetical protein ACRDWV_10540 [Acidimicrobiales bacterium]
MRNTKAHARTRGRHLGPRSATGRANTILLPVAAMGILGISLFAPIATGTAHAETATATHVTDTVGNIVADRVFSRPAVTTVFTTYSPGSQINGVWTVLGSSASGAGVNLSSNQYIPPPTNDVSTAQTVDLTGNDLNTDTAEPDGIEQTIPTVSGDTYTVYFQLSDNPYGEPAVGADTLSVHATDVTSGNSVGPVTSYTGPTTSSASSSAAMNWEPESYTFTATGPSTVLALDSTTQNATDYGPVVTNVQTGITENEVIPTIAACATGTLTLEERGPDGNSSGHTWSADTNLPSGVTLASGDGNTEVSPSEVKAGPFPGAVQELTYQVTVPCSATPGSILTATTASTFTSSDGPVASIDVEIDVAPVAASPLANPAVIGGAFGTVVVVLGGVVLFRRRRLSQAQ